MDGSFSLIEIVILFKILSSHKKDYLLFISCKTGLIPDKLIDLRLMDNVSKDFPSISLNYSQIYS